MKMSTKGRYALRMMTDFAANGQDGYISLKDVAERQKISMKYLEQIVSMLTRAGMLHSVRGPQGGYKLARKPEQYTMAEILRVTEGDLAPVVCLEENAQYCELADVCAAQPYWAGLHKVAIEYMQSVTLADLADTSKVKAAAMHDKNKTERG